MRSSPSEPKRPHYNDMGLTILDHEGRPVVHGRTRLSTGVRLHYYTAGSGPALLLQHGVPKTSYFWRKVVPKLSHMYTCVVPDMRGLGDSTHMDGGYDMATVADDIAELMKHLGYGKFYIIGEDWGAAAAYQVAARYRERVLGLVRGDEEIVVQGCQCSLFTLTGIPRNAFTRLWSRRPGPIQTRGPRDSSLARGFLPRP